ncbi:MAG TPA: universal stress protein [Nitrososphaeraceae archaeon]|nr:universal stress protein [Nitrososphaeraceae archaeon]
MTVRRILVAVDGSKPSIDASVQAIDIAKKLGAELIALYVISPDTRYHYLEDTLTPKLPSAFKEVLMMAMQRGEKHVNNVRRMAKQKNIKVKTDVIVGISSVVKEILEYAEKNKIDMIVIGSRGLSGFKKMLLGSVASGVVTYAHCPVLVAK